MYTIVQTKNGWGKLEKNGYWIKLSYTTSANSASNAASEKKPTQPVRNTRPSSGSSYKVRVKVTALNMRTGPGTGYKSRGKLKKGTYWITRTKNGWGRLKKKRLLD